MNSKIKIARRQPWKNNRILIAASLVLGVIVWLVFAFVNSDREERTIHNVPLRYDLTGTMASQLNLQPFFPSDVNPEDIRISVVVSARRYDTVTWQDISAQLIVENVNMAGDYSLGVRPTYARPGDEARFDIKNYYIGGITTQKFLAVSFDVERTLPFELIPTVIGEVKVPEGFHAGDLMLSKKYVSITGPQRKLANISEVRAETVVKEPLEKTTEYNKISIVPVDADGNPIPQFLVIEGDVNATLPVWEIAQLHSMVDFLGAPEAYYANPLRYTVTPSSVQAASAGIAPDHSLRVGTIDFAALSPGDNTKTFLAKDLTQIAFLDGTEAFVAWVDMTGMAERTLRLPADNITLSGKTKARLRDVQRVTVVGPADDLAELTPDNLAGEAIMAENTAASALEVRVRVVQTNQDGKEEAHPSCWVYGKYTVSAALG